MSQPDLGKALRKFRESKRMSGKDFAEKTGISQGHVSELENGRKNLTSNLIERIASGCGMDSSDLLRDLESLIIEIQEQSPNASENILNDDPAPYRFTPRQNQYQYQQSPDDMQFLAEWVIGEMTAEARADLLRKLMESAISGDVAASAAARALLLLVRKFTDV